MKIDPKISIKQLIESRAEDKRDNLSAEALEEIRDNLTSFDMNQDGYIGTADFLESTDGKMLPNEVRTMIARFDAFESVLRLSDTKVEGQGDIEMLVENLRLALFQASHAGTEVELPDGAVRNRVQNSDKRLAPKTDLEISLPHNVGERILKGGYQLKTQDHDQATWDRDEAGQVRITLHNQNPNLMEVTGRVFLENPQGELLSLSYDKIVADRRQDVSGDTILRHLDQYLEYVEHLTDDVAEKKIETYQKSSPIMTRIRETAIERRKNPKSVIALMHVEDARLERVHNKLDHQMADLYGDSALSSNREFFNRTSGNLDRYLDELVAGDGFTLAVRMAGIDWDWPRSRSEHGLTEHQERNIQNLARSFPKELLQEIEQKYTEVDGQIATLKKELQERRDRLASLSENKPKEHGPMLDDFRTIYNEQAIQAWALRKQIGAHASVRMVLRVLLKEANRSNQNMKFNDLPDAEIK